MHFRQAEIPTDTVHIPLPCTPSIAVNRTLFNAFWQTCVIKGFGRWRRAGWHYIPGSEYLIYGEFLFAGFHGR
jgi:hypothetical protein